MGDQESLNRLLQWGIDNSTANTTNTTTNTDPTRGLSSKALAELLGGPSDADRMRHAMSAIVAPPEEDLSDEQRAVAWDNLEQLVEGIDNADNLAPLGLWPPLVGQLEGSRARWRACAAGCVATAVQNNARAQERLLEQRGALPALARMAVADPDPIVRKKAASAVSSAVRNCQPAMDELRACSPDELWPGGRAVDAGDMDDVDELIKRLRNHAAGQ